MQTFGDSAFLALLARRTTNAVIVTDAAGRTEWVNDGFTRITGYAPAEIIGRSPGSLLQGPDTDPAAVARMDAHLARGEPFNLEILNYAADGRSYWVEIDCEPIVEAGEITHFIAIETDVTHRKRLERNLLRAERVAKMGHWTLEMATGAVNWSDETYRIFDLPEGSPVPALDTVIAFYHPGDQAAVREIIQSAA
jgi:PAS domain S-box-containing protein